MTIRGTLATRNVTINGRRTSLRLEFENWMALEEICLRESLTAHELCTLIDGNRRGFSRTSAVRAFITAYFRELSGRVNVGGDMPPPALERVLQTQVSS